ncbi:MAG TPA: alpha/beta fold hydrolase [Patescibacteria group bacterium]|nr:alpha/beta fold hydrolase [Patescibacteria group bacterium]
MKKAVIFDIIVCVLSASAFFLLSHQALQSISRQTKTVLPTTFVEQNPLQIQAMREKSYPGSPITIEQTLPDGSNYHQYLTSYYSDGLKIYALLTVPTGIKPKSGWPVIVFNHGYITPQSYQTFPTIGQYTTYYPPFAAHGYIVFKPDYRGNGNSQGQPEGAYYSPAYTVDDLNAVASIKQYKDVNPNKIGVWGHSMGGNITMRDLVIATKDIKAAVIWGGVVGDYTELEHWHDPAYHPSAYELSLRNKYRATLQKQFGTPESNPIFWNSVDPTSFASSITAPVQLHVGGADEEVPTSFSQTFYQKLQSAGKTVEFYSYPGTNHNITQGFALAMQRSLNFFDRYLK